MKLTLNHQKTSFKTMRTRILLLLTVTTVLFSCKGEDEFVLEGTVQGVDGKNIILQAQEQNTGITIPRDTVKIVDGKFKFTGKILEPSIHQLAIDGVPAKSFLILESGDINIEINKDSIHLNKITGTYNNDQLTEYNAKAIKIQNKIKSFEKANADKMKNAKATNDTATVRNLMDQYMVVVGSVKKDLADMTEKYIKGHPKSFISVLLLQSYFNSYTVDIPKIEGMFKNIDADLQKTKAGKLISKRLSENKSVKVGNKAPEFSAPTPEGKPVSLRESMGKVTIIDFWASWCAPCRAENPNVVALYNEYHAKGLNIISVSLDKPGQADKWKGAIAKDQLAWTQVSNLQHWEDPIVKMYGVESIPATFILNESGVVVAKDLRGAELKAKVAQLLGS